MACAPLFGSSYFTSPRSSKALIIYKNVTASISATNHYDLVAENCSHRSHTLRGSLMILFLYIYIGRGS
ncbi:hypothetical protein HanHA300_Chr04g0137091 [Helianthus annuus]|nr:hypothetical protein HanHA300_Chr04g0137091 [Helianthus annuus]KAJ0597047.1 hypothetical protein HanHA89_Chr04g0150051 [Helianthus annuus]KAJ0757729.1 hypothetical protein HanLR1_Chr04g0142161 [Helianthus annuus]